MLSNKRKFAEDDASPSSSETIAYDANEYIPAPEPVVQLGDRKVNSIGIGTLPWSVSYPEPGKQPSEDDCTEMIHLALSVCSSDKTKGSTFFDTAEDAYCRNPPSDLGYMERLLFSEIGMNPSALIASKGGMYRVGPQSKDWRTSCDLAHFKPSDFASIIQCSHL